MTTFIAALPMYDWPELVPETDAQWAAIRDRLREGGIDAPANLTRRNIASGELDLAGLWRDPRLIFSQTCWGPMEAGLEGHVRVIAQPDYSAYEGGEGELYSSAIVMRGEGHACAPANRCAQLPLDLMRGKRLVYNGPDSMSGLLALSRDLDAAGESLGIFSSLERSGSHRASALAVAGGGADVAAIDCRTWSLFRRFEPDAAKRIQVVGWTARRKGLPFIAAAGIPDHVLDLLRAALAGGSSRG